MNDFTKEELVYLKDGVSMLERCEMNTLLRKKLEDLWIKTSKMIDSYCDHESLDFVGDVFGYYCNSCNKQFGSDDVGSERHDRIINGDE